MSSGRTLRQLIKSGTSGDMDAFRLVTEEVIREEREKQHHLLANDLEKILYGRPIAAPLTLRRLSETVPTDRERGLPLLEIREPVRNLDDVILSGENRALIESILLEHRRAEVLQSYGLRPVDRLLFHGPPGCGKTLTAEVLAAELSRPLAIVRMDSLISSFLGETAANLRKVFDFAKTTPLLLLFDEFDAVAKERSDQSEHGELKRVVNAVLQMMDNCETRSVLIAATNHEAILDSAVWRRFEEVLVFALPTLGQLQSLLEMKLRGVRRDFDPRAAKITSRFKGLSHADVERVLRHAIKEMILQGQEFLQIQHLENALQREQTRNKSTRSMRHQRSS
ncbi:MAG: ATP-binding protein [Acidobacteria bacterium]|nr:ATP-binding protein [Acidobacteriota bacterium]MBI3424144.1 ATP-binding protein [Acidobacteriota bacterium]